MDEPIVVTRQQIVDEEHLKLLWIAYLVSAGLSALISSLGLLYGLIGILMASALPSIPPGVGPDPEMIAGLITAAGFAFAAVMLVLAALKFAVAQCLKRRQGRIFCMFVAGLCCLGVPYGTLLGVFTFIVLGRSTVDQLFAASRSSGARLATDDVQDGG